mgnify:CR=1 FL=1
MKNYLKILAQGKHLDQSEAKSLILQMTNGKTDPNLIAAILMAYHLMSPNLDEIKGFRQGLYERTEIIDLSSYNPMDMCGTGGDGKDTLNISTLASFVASSCGIPIAKHGNYGSSSVCGSSNVLEYLGYKFKKDSEALNAEMDANQICFIHAPLFHPSLKNVATIRKALGIKTLFNILGPLVNPCQPKIQSSGVFNLDTMRQYHYLLQDTHEKHCIVHSMDGYDEISLTGKFKLLSSGGEFVFHPNDLDLSIVQHQDIRGGTSIKDSAAMFIKVLKGKGTTMQNSVIAINAAVAMHCYDPSKTIQSYHENALECILSGKPYTQLTKTINQ